MHPRLATLISTIGNPLLLFPLVVTYLTVSEVGLEAAKPLLITLAAIFGILGAFLLIRRLRGKISNLDVSDRKQRAVNIYLPALVGILLAAAFFQWSEEPFVYKTLYVGLLFGTCFAINSVKKISLHTVVATYVSGLLTAVNLWVGIAFFVFSVLIAWSRVVLGRHTTEEVLLGWFVGTAFGLLHAFLF